MFDEKSTVGETVAFAKAYLKSCDIESYSLDAEVLYCHAFQVSRSNLLASSSHALPKKNWTKYVNLIKRRAKHVPVSYITRSKEFYSSMYYVDERVLIPRPDTEVLVEGAIGHLKRREQENKQPQKFRVLDMATGSGCVGLSIALNVPNSFVTLSDISAQALEVAAQNLETHHLRGRVEILQSNWFENITQTGFDIITVNPPYIPTKEIASLAKDVREFEPMEALDGGRDGLAHVETICAGLKARIAPEGAALIEVGIGQSRAVRDMLVTVGFEYVEILKDLAGIERVVKVIAGH